MEKKNAQHTVIIPSYNTLEHTKNTYQSIKKYAPNVPMIIIDDASEDGTANWLNSLKDDNLTVIADKIRRGHTYWYDEGMRYANTEIVSILHSDMIIGPNYFENMLKHLEKGKIVCATRIEPPIHPAGMEKHTQNFGIEHNEFDWKAFDIFCNNTLITDKDKTTKGIFAPWILYKEDHLSIGGHDQRFAPYGYEDSDIFNRWIQAGYEMVQSRDALCYHMTCRGHRWNAGVGIENSDYRETMDRCRREFIRKWGDWIQNDKYQMPIIWTKYDRGIIIKNSNPQLIEMLEPWGDNLYVDTPIENLLEYIEKESNRTVTDLYDRIKPYENEKQNNILIEIDGENFNQQDMIYIQKVAEILDTQKPESGTFKLGNILLTIIQNKHD
tara:strand:+ start:604 stop:1752 length:1149 start_codon:yes stop_codon:yes gene_type:complete